MAVADVPKLVGGKVPEKYLARMVPNGGTTGQALVKTSNTDQAVGWGSVATGTGTGGTQVKVDGANVSEFLVDSDTVTVVDVGGKFITQITQAAYTALAVKDPNTLFVIVG